MLERDTVNAYEFAAPARKRHSGPSQYTEVFAQGFDSATNKTRALVTRDSDSEPHAIFASGSHADIVDAHNTRSRLTHEHRSLVETEPDDDASAEIILSRLAEIEVELDALVKTQCKPTFEVARTLAYFASSDDDDDE